MARYRFVTEWQVDAPVERVWDALLLVGDWPTWWKGFRAVEQLRAGDDSGVGTQIRQRWRSLLPFTLVLDLEITYVERRRLLEGQASGDMKGRCTWILGEEDGRTSVAFVMDVRPTRWWMDLPLPFAGRIVAWNYNAIMRWGGEGLARLLADREAERTARTEMTAA
jgi:hypothetical protein